MDQDQWADDEEWMRRVADDQRDALAVLVRRHAGPLLTFIQRMVGDRHRAEEVFQDVFLAVWTHRHRYQYPRRFRCWLFGIAANKCRAYCRGSLASWLIVADPPDGPAADPDPSPLDTAIHTETASVVGEAVARLPAAQRTVLVLRLWNGLSYTEIAQALDRAEASVRSNMHHALAAVRKYLEPRMRRGD